MIRARAAIRSIASYLPAGKLTNAQLAQQYQEWGVEKISAKTGIAVRHIAAPDECASDLAVAAARRLFERGACAPDDVDFLILCTQSPDYFLPTTACLVQDRLGLRTDCGALDVNQGCSGFVYGLALAKSLVETGTVRNVLLLTAETYSKFINPRDRSVRTIFGDAAAATLVSAVDADEEVIGPLVFGTDGRGAQHLIVPAGGARRPLTPEALEERQDGRGNWRSARDLYMNGHEVFTFTLQAVPAAVSQLLEKAELSLQDVDYFVFHQANKFMLDRLRARLGIPQEKFCICMEHCGNTVSSTIPIALEHALETRQVKPGDRLMLVGFGVGYSWAAALMRVV